MKFNLFRIIFLAMCFFGCKSSTPQEIKDTKHYTLKDVKPYMKSIAAGTIKNTDFENLSKYLKKNFDIDIAEIKYLTVSYLKPRSLCWYDNYSVLRRKKSDIIIDDDWWKTQSNTQIIKLHSDKGYTDSWSQHDPENFFYNLFPDAKGSDFCDFTITLSASKNFFIKLGHFNYSVSNAFRNELEKYDFANQLP